MSEEQLRLELQRERESHKLKEELYEDVVFEADSMRREAEGAGERAEQELQDMHRQVGRLKVELERARRTRDSYESRMRETETTLRETEAELAEADQRLTEALVAATQCAARADAAEQTAERLRTLTLQLESDIQRIRSAKGIELDNYRSDLKDAHDEVELLTERLRESEAERVKQSNYISDITKAELQLNAAKRKTEQSMLRAEQKYREQEYVATSRLQESEAVNEQQRSYIEDLTRQERALSASWRHMEQELFDARRTIEDLRDDVTRLTNERDGAVRELSFHEGCYTPSSTAERGRYDALRALSEECVQMVTTLEAATDSLSKRLAELTRHVLSVCRQDTELLQVVEAMGHTRSTTTPAHHCCATIAAENERLSAMVKRAAFQMETFNEAVARAEAAYPSPFSR